MTHRSTLSGRFVCLSVFVDALFVDWPTALQDYVLSLVICNLIKHALEAK